MDDESEPRRSSTSMSQLVGKTVASVWVSEGEERLAFMTDAGVIGYNTEADCCSETWFADVNGIDALIGRVVTATEIVEMPAPEDGRTRQEYDEAYGVKITTSGGVCDIVYRNSSNGYYGGGAYYSTDIKSVDGFRQISGDWSA